MVIFSIPVPSEIAALLTRISQRPCLASIFAARAVTLASSPISTTMPQEVPPAALILAAAPFGDRFLDVGDHDMGALLGQPPRNTEADPLGAAGHHRNTAVQPLGRTFRHSLLLGFTGWFQETRRDQRQRDRKQQDQSHQGH